MPSNLSLQSPYVNLLLAVTLVGLLLVGAGCHTNTHQPFTVETWEDVTWFTVEADGGGSLMVADSPEADPGSGDHVKASTNQQQGLSRAVASMQNQDRPDPYVFPMQSPVGSAMYLNVSQPIVGTLYFSNALSQTASATNKGIEAGKIRMELFVDDQLAGGYEYEFNPAMAAEYGTAGAGHKTWMMMNLLFYPEVLQIPAGSVVSLHITQISGLSDFYIGTGGDHQSFLEIHYYTFDPLGGAVYLEDRRLVTSPTGPESESRESFLERAHEYAESGKLAEHPPGVVILPPADRADEDDGAVLAVAGLALLPLFGLIAPRRPGRIMRASTKVLLALALVSIGLAGCFGGGGEAEISTGGPNGGGPQAGVNQTFEENETLKQAGVGAAEGLVQSDVGLPVQGAHVSFLGTNLFAKTDGNGFFAFQVVEAGEYTIRVDKEGFESLEKPVTVKAGSVAKLNITIVPPASVGGGLKPHIHDEWGELTRILVHDVDFTPPSNVYTQNVATTGRTLCDPHYDRYGTSTAPGGQGDDDHGCHYPVPIDFSDRIIPGTTLVEVVLHWDGPSSNVPQEMGISFTNPLRSAFGLNYMVPREPGEPFYIAMFPNEADPGHQQFTNWQFYVYVPDTDLYAPWGPAYYEFNSITFEAFVHKGVVPYEPAHRDFWNNRTSMDLFSPEESGSWVVSTSCRPSATHHFDVMKGSWVPPGTQKLEGQLTWRYTDGAPASIMSTGTEISLAMKPANVPSGAWAEGLKKVTVTDRTATSISWEYVPAPTEFDQFYQAQSNWEAYVIDAANEGDDCVPGLSYRYTQYFTISGTAVKDPSYKHA